ncbi:MAG: hypothetical protein JNL94_00935 [Planctomycetes bacterium]|nr:hypothetical protein [Planctomycetota bacterium]
MTQPISTLPEEFAADDARALLDRAPCVVFVRHASGRVVYANAAARTSLGFDEAASLSALTLTRLVGDGDRDGDSKAAFLVLVEREPKARITANTRPLGGDREALFVAAEQALPRTVTEPGSRRRFMTTRALAADVVRRVRRHSGKVATEPVRAHHRLERGHEGTRLVRVDPVGIAQLVLSGVLLLAESDSPCTGIQFALVGLQLRIVIEGEASRAAGIFPDLRRQTALLRSIRPILSEHDATFSVERDKRGSRRVVISVPLAG